MADRWAHAADVGVLPAVPAVPERYMLSVRCFIRVGDALIVCENADGTHVWPGGRRESGETVAQTAVREVYEETGWVVDTESIRQVGLLLHYHHLTPVAADHPYPLAGIRGSHKLTSLT